MANDAVEYIRSVWDSIIHGKKNKKAKNSAIEEIEEFINGYGESKVPAKPSLPDAPEYERMKYDAPDDDAIKASAENELAAYKAQGEKGVEKEIKALAEKYDSDLESAAQAHDTAVKKTEESYTAAKSNTNNDMLKRGLARSSIAANKMSELEEGEAEAKAQLSAAYAKQVNELNEKINSLDSARAEALNDFNLSYATKLTERINELKEQRDDKMAEALKYNNTLAEKEYNAAVNKQKTESDLYSEALSQREKENELSETSQKDYLAVYTAIAEKLRTINKNDARDIVLNNPNVRLGVGDVYYYKLYDEFCR